MKIRENRRRVADVSCPRDGISPRRSLSRGGPTPPARHMRRGITLFEVVVALVIFTLTLPALNTLVIVGTQRAEETAYLSVATMLCRSILAEAMVGAGPMDTSDWSPSEMDPNYHWKMNAADTNVDNVRQVQVWVKYDVGMGPIIQVTLSQMMIEPDNRGSTQDRGLIDAALAAAGVLPQTSSASTTTTPAASTGSTATGATSGAATTGSTGAATGGATGGVATSGAATGGAGGATGGGGGGGGGATKGATK